MKISEINHLGIRFQALCELIFHYHKHARSLKKLLNAASKIDLTEGFIWNESILGCNFWENVYNSGNDKEKLAEIYYEKYHRRKPRSKKLYIHSLWARLDNNYGTLDLEHFSVITDLLSDSGSVYPVPACISCELNRNLAFFYVSKSLITTV